MSKNNGSIDIKSLQKDFFDFKQKGYYLDNLKKIIFEQYLGLVKYVVRKMIKSFPQCLEEADLYQIGIIGLNEAIDRFNPNYGTKFETYAIPRIKGSIIDELRKLDWIPRSLRVKFNSMREKTVELDQIFLGNHTKTDMANKLGINKKTLYRWEKDYNSANIYSLDRPLNENKDNLYGLIKDENYQCPQELMENNEIKKIMIQTINLLSVKSKMLIALYYYEKLTFEEIGKILNVSESRISQIHSEIMLKLKKAINKKIYA